MKSATRGRALRSLSITLSLHLVLLLTLLHPSQPATIVSPSANSVSFGYTGASQTYVVPAGVSYLRIDACGGEGGANQEQAGKYPQGGYISSIIPVTPGTTLYIYVGGTGQATAGIGGYNGGGGGQVERGFSNGGGGTDIRTGNGGTTGSQNVNTRLVVAGGAGSYSNKFPYPLGNNAAQGWSGMCSGGGLVGANGDSTPGNGDGGQGGSQTAGGKGTNIAGYTGASYDGQFWSGGYGLYSRGGGGGYYGGGAGSGNDGGAGGGSSYTIASGTILTNTRGDARCTGNGQMFVTPYDAPTALPTSMPTILSLPTLSPTGQYFMYHDQADFLYTSVYNGLHCNGSVVGLSIKAFDLNQCMPSNNAASKYHPYMHKCYVGAKKVSIVEDTFSDYRCTQVDGKGSTPNGGVIYHGDVCQKVAKGMPGQSAKARCDTLSPRHALRDLVLIQSYLHGGCTGSPTTAGQNPEVVALFLNTCTFFLTQDREKFHRILTYVSGNGYTTDLVLQSALYAHSDKHCSQLKLGELETVVYKAVDGTGPCLPDPLLPKRFYKNVLRTTNMMQTRPDWVTLPTWAAPTTSPTLFPTSLPTVMPSLPPTPLPTSSPTPRPTSSSPPELESWISRLTAASTGASSTVLLAHRNFIQTLSTAGVLSKIVRLNTFSGNDVTAAFIPLIPGGGSAVDSAYGGAFSGSYTLTGGLTSGSGQMVNTGQRISHTNLLDTTSAASDGSNIHIGMYFLDGPQNCRLMGVYRQSVYTRHYLLSDGLGLFGWGNSFGGNQITSGLSVVTGTSSGASRYVCSKGTASSCSQSAVTGVDRSQPSDWPVGLFGCFGSGTGVITESMGPYGVCSATRSAGYTIGTGLTTADLTALNTAWNQLNADMGRV